MTPDAEPGPRDLSADPLEGDTAIAAYFGARYDTVRAFGALLADQGVIRGLIGPREVTRMWERHLLNSAAVVPFLGEGTVADVGSGAGLPGLVIATLEPERSVVLIEPMERRVEWLLEASRSLGLSNVTVVRGRADEVSESVRVDVVTARAVASTDKLVKWCAPLTSAGGRMVFLKGRTAADEIDRAKYVLRKHGLTAEVHTAATIAGVEPTTVVVLERD